MLKFSISLLLSLLFSMLYSQKSEEKNIAEYSQFFSELNHATRNAFSLWNTDISGPILLVDPATRKVYSNEADEENILKKQYALYTGELPKQINIANTSVQWNGKLWAMVMLPLPSELQDRVNLLAHELFHRSQSSLGFTQNNKESYHLDQKEGRIYLRLELVALLQAVSAKSKKEKKMHLTNAFIFRKYRNSLFPESATLENDLELNEGLAEYTGMMISKRNESELKAHFKNTNDEFIKNPTYVRSFAYHTVPLYGYLLNKSYPLWNQRIKNDSNLTDFFIKAFAVKIPTDLKSSVNQMAHRYDLKKIQEEEELRAHMIQKQINAYKDQLIYQPHLVIKFEKMNVSFDPRNILPLEDHGTVYPNIRVTDLWGILEVTNGALMSPNWDKISVSKPIQFNEKEITGDGWKLQLNENYAVEKDASGTGYTLIKK